MSGKLADYEQVLTAWFKDIGPKQWWAVDPVLDDLLQTRFLSLLQQASVGALFAWRTSVYGRLAEIIVLDQFSRNIYRHTEQAFAQDPMALVLAQEAVTGGVLAELDEMERAFLLMPYMHSESPIIHVEAERLFREHTPSHNYEFELRHKVIIDRFGRYPHRNDLLGRTSTTEEKSFLLEPGSSF